MLSTPTPSDANDPLDRDALILSRVEMARRTAHNFRSAGKYPIENEELESEAYLALTEAAESYDPRTTCLSWGAYASRAVIWRLQDFMQRWYRLERVDFVSGKPDERHHLAITSSRVPPPVARPTDPSACLMAEDAARLVRQLLTPREQRIVRLRYQEGKNLRQIAREVGLTHLHCRQLHCAAMKLLREVMNGDSVRLGVGPRPAAMAG